MFSIRTTLLIACLSQLVTLTATPVSHNHAQAQNKFYRKFNTAVFFQNLANTCANAGTVASAQTEKEKQQAACNTLASVFQTAAAMAEKSKKRSVAQPIILATTIKATLVFLNTLTAEARSCIISPNYEYLQAFAALKTEKEQTKFITQTLASKENGSAFINELFSLFKAIVTDQLPALLDAAQQEVRENLYLN